MRLIFCVFIISALAACGSSNDGPGSVAQAEQNETQSSRFLRQVEGSRYLSQGSSLELGPKGDFEFFLRTPLRHFPRRDAEGARRRYEVDVVCKVRFTGKAAFFTKKEGISASGARVTLANQLELSLEGAEVISAAPSTDFFPRAEIRTSRKICEEYAALNLLKKQVNVAVSNYSKDAFQLGYLPFEIEKKADEAPGNPKFLYSFAPRSMGEDGHADRFFVRNEVESFDITSVALQELNGKYVGRNSLGDHLELVLDEQLKEIRVTFRGCAVQARLAIEKVWVERGYLRMRGKNLSLVSIQVGDGPRSTRGRAACDPFEDLLKDFSQAGLALTYGTLSMKWGRVVDQVTDVGVLRDSASLSFERK